MASVMKELEACRDVVVRRVSQVMKEVLEWPNSCHQSLDEVAQDGQHRQPPALHLLQLQLSFMDLKPRGLKSGPPG